MIGPARGALATVALILLAADAAPGAAGGPAPATETVDDADAAGEPRAGALAMERRAATAVSGALQGRDGVRIQTLCTHCNTSNVQLGGLSRELVPLSRDGFPVFGGLATSLVLSILPPDTIAGARAVKGPGSARLPAAAAGGAIALESAPAEALPWLDAWAESGSFSLERASLRIAGSPGTGVSGTLVAGLASVDRIDDDRDGWTDVPAVERDFAEGTLEIAPGGRHRVFLGGALIDESNLRGRGRFDALRYILNGEDAWTREDTFFRREELRAGWEWRPRGGGRLELRALDASRDQRLRSQLTGLASGFGIPEPNRLIDRFVIEEDDRWAALTYSRTLGTQWRLGAGVESSRQDVDAVNRDLLAPDDTPTALERVERWSTYVDATWSPTPQFNLDFGLRRDDADLLTALDRGLPGARVTVRSDGATSPRVTLRWLPTPAWTLRLVGGKTFRPPRPILAEVCCGQEYQTTERVAAERSGTLGLEATYAPGPDLRVAAYVATTDFDDHILRVAGFSQVFLQTYALANVPRARAGRAELAASWSPSSRLALDAGIGWLSFRNTGPERVDVFVVPPSFAAFQTIPVAMARIPYQPERSATLAARTVLPRNVSLAVEASYTGSMHVQQFERVPFNSALDTDTLRRTPGFWLTNVSGEVRVYDHLRLYLAVDNLSDRIQNDLGDPTTDYNWGPLAGRSWRGLRISLDR